MTANDILQQAAATLTQRGTQYDSTSAHERSADIALEIYTALFGPAAISKRHIWYVLIAVKFARLRTATSPAVTHDTIIDLINYIALLGEELTKTSSAVYPTEMMEARP